MKKIRIYSRHPSHKILRTELPRLPIKSAVRFGSVTEVNDDVLQINTIESIKISSNKKLMKEKFDQAEVRTAPWTSGNTIEIIKSNLASKDIKYPIVAKSFYGSRGMGNTLLRNEEEFNNFCSSAHLSNYIFEKYMSYLLEYRLHVTKDGCFYTCRKALKRDTNEKDRWRRHKDNSIWFLEESENFRKPNSWKDIEIDCVKAMQTIGADILCFDVRVQSEKDIKGKTRDYQNFVLIESNSAPSMNNDNGVSICAAKYLEILPKVIMDKAGLVRGE